MDGPSLSKVLSASDDNLVEYYLFPGPKLTAQAQAPADAENDELFLSLSAAATTLAKDYIWHNEGFELRKISTGSTGTGPLIIYGGKTGYGDNVEDEWFIVHLLLELTKQFDDLVVRVIDHDGEFLLIEAAEHLPPWAESDSVCSQRVYLYQGKVHLVSTSLPETGTPDKTEPLDIFEAISIVRDPNNPTEASAPIQASISTRIGSFPEKMYSNFHHVNVFLPPKVGIILKRRPDLVSSAIQAFYFKDPIDLKVARNIKHFEFKDIKDLVKFRVRCTRALYAMLTSQDYRPDVTRTNWKFPSGGVLDKDYKAHCLGAKLTLGFEILLSKCKKTQGSEEQAQNLDSSPQWLRYEEKLKSYNYYQGFLEESKPWRELKSKALAYFKSTMNDSEPKGIDKKLLLCQEISATYNSITPEDIKGIKEENQCQTTTAGGAAAAVDSNAGHIPDDDETWMEINPDDLESLLEAQFKSRISDKKLDQIPEKLKEFLNQMSDFTGVETAGGGSGTKNSSSATASATLDEIGLEPLDFRADDFVSAMDKLLAELGKPDGEWDGSDQEGFTDDDDEEEIKRLEEFERDIFTRHNFAPDSKIHQLMGQMDEELAQTEVGKTFTGFDHSGFDNGLPSSSKKTKTTGTATTAQVEELDDFDDETAATASGSSSSKYAPVDIDMNALTNLLESFNSQTEPDPGPSETLLRSVGFDMSKPIATKDLKKK